METTTVCDCGHVAVSNGFSTGYGVDKDNKKICFACCGEGDKDTLIKTGKLSGYFNGKEFLNWPGTFRISVSYIRKSWHNFAGKDGRTDFWLFYNGQKYHGVQIGHNNDCATIRRTK